MVRPCDIIIDKCDHPEKQKFGIDHFLYPEWYRHSVVAYYKTRYVCIFLMKTKKGFWFTLSYKGQRRSGFGYLPGHYSQSRRADLGRKQDRTGLHFLLYIAYSHAGQ